MKNFVVLFRFDYDYTIEIHKFYSTLLDNDERFRIWQHLFELMFFYKLYCYSFSSEMVRPCYIYRLMTVLYPAQDVRIQSSQY